MLAIPHAFKGHGEAWCPSCQWISGMYGDWLGHAVEANACWMVSARFSQTATEGPYVSEPRALCTALFTQVSDRSVFETNRPPRQKATVKVSYSDTHLFVCQTLGRAVVYGGKIRMFSGDFDIQTEHSESVCAPVPNNEYKSPCDSVPEICWICPTGSWNANLLMNKSINSLINS